MAGANFVFALNAACFFLVVLAVRQWKQSSAQAKLPSERFFESFGTVIRYTRNAPGFQVVLARNFLFALFISVVPALMPVVGLKVLQLSSSNLGLLFTSMGAGSVLGAVFIIPWLRARFSSDCLAFLANSLPFTGFFGRQEDHPSYLTALFLSRTATEEPGSARLSVALEPSPNSILKSALAS
jgi:hypothetical protein